MKFDKSDDKITFDSISTPFESSRKTSQENFLTHTTFNFNYSFFRNFVKNLSKYLHIVSLNEKALYSLLTFSKLLSKQFFVPFDENILEKLYLLIKKYLKFEDEGDDEVINNKHSIKKNTFSDISVGLHVSKKYLLRILCELKDDR